VFSRSIGWFNQIILSSLPESILCISLGNILGCKCRCIHWVYLWVYSQYAGSLQSTAVKSRLKRILRKIFKKIHQQQPLFQSGTHGCSWQLWCLWQNLLPSEGELHSSHRPGEGSHCMLTFCTLCPGCGDVYTPSEWHVWYTVRSGSSNDVAVYTMPGDVYAFLRPSDTLYLSSIAIYWMPYSPHICLDLRCCHLLQFSLGFGYIACHCICFAIIIFYRSEIYCPIFTRSSNMPSILPIVRRSMVVLHWLFLHIHIRIVGIIALIPFNIAASQVQPHEFTCSPLSPSSPPYPSTSLVSRSNIMRSLVARCRRLVVGIASCSSLLSTWFLSSLLPFGIPKCNLSSMQLLSIGMCGSVLLITDCSSATSDVK